MAGGVSPPYAQHWPSNDPRVITLKCRECKREWVELVPEKNAKAFCWGLTCRCGENAEGYAIVVVSGRDFLRGVVHGG